MSRDPYEDVLEVLRDDDRVRLVYGFGSFVQGVVGPLSDLDLAVLLERRLDWDAERNLRARLAAVSPRVDLVILNEAPPVLRYEILTTGRCLLARDPDEQAEFEITSLSRFLDFQPVRRVQQQYLQERVRERRGPAD